MLDLHLLMYLSFFRCFPLSIPYFAHFLFLMFFFNFIVFDYLPPGFTGEVMFLVLYTFCYFWVYFRYFRYPDFSLDVTLFLYFLLLLLSHSLLIIILFRCFTSFAFLHVFLRSPYSGESHYRISSLIFVYFFY